jgi:AraC-like DNA-binding protein
MASAAGNFAPFRFSTEGLPPERRLAMWHEALDGSVGGRRSISPISDDPFHVEMAVHRLGRAGDALAPHAAASVLRMTATVCGTLRRTPGPDDNDDIILHIHQTGRRIVSQRGREATAEPGGGVIVSSAHAATHVLPDPSRFVIIGVPRKLMMALAPGLEDALVQPLPPSAGVLRLLLRYLDVLEEDQALGTPELQRAVATHIHDLCALAIGATRDATEVARERGLRAARMRAIKAEIAQRFQHGPVSAELLARSQRVSPRYIHKLFETEGTTLSRFVLGQRLARVHRMLTDPALADLTIGAIAYRAGFGDLSTFNRKFRQHFGATPSDIRAATQTDAALRLSRDPRGSDRGSA